MEKKENPGGQAGTQENASAFFTRLYCTTGARPQDWISSFLSEGRENALTATELAQLLHVRKRTISRAIERARRAGVPVLAECDTGKNPGYFLPASPDELSRYIGSLRGRVLEISATLEAIEEAAATWFSEGGDGG